MLYYVYKHIVMLPFKLNMSPVRSQPYPLIQQYKSNSKSGNIIKTEAQQFPKHRVSKTPKKECSVSLIIVRTSQNNTSNLTE